MNISWYYKPKDVFSSVPNFISEAELFSSNLNQDIPVQSIYGKIEVLAFPEYYDLEEADSDVFFVRATYDHKKKTLSPEVNDWVKACYCNTNINPDLMYVKCDACNDVFHLDCVGKIEESDEKWFCNNCKP